MPCAKPSIPILICSLIITTGSLLGGVKLQVRDGRPIVDGVFVNGQGPYRFLVDTGSNINLIETGIARKIGMSAMFQVDLGSATGKVPTSGSDGNEVALDSVKAGDQKFLFSRLDAIHNNSPDVQGVLGQWLFARFDYLLDLKGKRLEFGKQELGGTRVPFRLVNARPVVSTSLGELVLDSGAARLTLFGIRADSGVLRSELRTMAGSEPAAVVYGAHLLIKGRKIWDGDAVANANRSEPGVDGLLPVGLFKMVYVSNSDGFVILER